MNIDINTAHITSNIHSDAIHSNMTNINSALSQTLQHRLKQHSTTTMQAWRSHEWLRQWTGARRGSQESGSDWRHMLTSTPGSDVRDTGSIPGSGRIPGEGMAIHFHILVWRIPWTEDIYLPLYLCLGIPSIPLLFFSFSTTEILDW